MSLAHHGASRHHGVRRGFDATRVLGRPSMIGAAMMNSGKTGRWVTVCLAALSLITAAGCPKPGESPEGPSGGAPTRRLESSKYGRDRGGRINEDRMLEQALKDLLESGD